MEWVETTAKTVDEAKDRALDQLGVAADEAEFEIIEEPKGGLFGRWRGEARVRARVKPAAVRPKQDRRQRARKERAGAKSGGKGGPGGQGGRGGRGDKRGQDGGEDRDARSDRAGDPGTTSQATRGGRRQGGDRPQRTVESQSARGAPTDGRKHQQQQQHDEERTPMSDEQVDDQETVTPDEVGAAAAAFMAGLTAAFDVDAETSVDVDGTEIDVRVTGSDLGLLVGPGGRTLTAVQDLARVAAQRRLGDHDTRLRIDVGGYREKRREALERFAVAVAQQVIESGTAKALEPMSSADRKIVHDAITGVEGVTSRSDGDDPGRRVVISPV